MMDKIQDGVRIEAVDEASYRGKGIVASFTGHAAVGAHSIIFEPNARVGIRTVANLRTDEFEILPTTWRQRILNLLYAHIIWNSNPNFRHMQFSNEWHELHTRYNNMNEDLRRWRVGHGKPPE